MLSATGAAVPVDEGASPSKTWSVCSTFTRRGCGIVASAVSPSAHATTAGADGRPGGRRCAGCPRSSAPRRCFGRRVLCTVMSRRRGATSMLSSTGALPSLPRGANHIERAYARLASRASSLRSYDFSRTVLGGTTSTSSAARRHCVRSRRRKCHGQQMTRLS